MSTSQDGRMLGCGKRIQIGLNNDKGQASSGNEGKSLWIQVFQTIHIF
jgi:hypothetical protein